METNTVTCIICNCAFDNVRKLSKHINYVHKINLENYFSSYITPQPNCVVCDTPAKFISYHEGYSECCSSRSCCAINFRIKLRNDDDRYKQFTNKVSANMIAMWKTDQTERIENMKNTISNIVLNMTKEEKIQKYGYLNKLSDEDRKIFIEKLLQTGCHLWWKTATEDEKRVIYEKRWQTLKQNITNGPVKTITFSDKQIETMDNILSAIFNL